MSEAKILRLELYFRAHSLLRTLVVNFKACNSRHNTFPCFALQRTLSTVGICNFLKGAFFVRSGPGLWVIADASAFFSCKGSLWMHLLRSVSECSVQQALTQMSNVVQVKRHLRDYTHQRSSSISYSTTSSPTHERCVSPVLHVFCLHQRLQLENILCRVEAAAVEEEAAIAQFANKFQYFAARFRSASW